MERKSVRKDSPRFGREKKHQGSSSIDNLSVIENPQYGYSISLIARETN